MLLLTFLLLATASVGFMCIIARARVLRYGGEVAIAEVTDTPYIPRTSRSPNSPYGVQYRFQVPGSDRWYQFPEPMLSGTPRATVSQDTWLEAKKTGRVVYARHHPWLNLPEEATHLDGVVCPAIAGAVMTFSRWSLYGEMRRRLRAGRPNSVGAERD